MNRSVLLVAAALTAAGCGHDEPRPRRSASERLPRVEVVQPQRVTLARRVEVSAVVEALKRVDLCARVQGTVDYLPDQIDIGKSVAIGDVLVRLGVPDLEADAAYKKALWAQAKSQMTQAEEARTVAEREVEEARQQEKRWEADLAFQKLKHERVRELVRKGAQDRQLEEEAKRQLDAADAAWQASRSQIATREAKVRSAAADLAVARDRIQVAEADARKVGAMIELATIRAPFAGVISKRWVDPGATIKDPGAPLLTLGQVNRVRVLIDVPQRDVPLLNAREQNPNPDGKGDAVTVRIPALEAAVPRGEFTGDVTRLAGALDPMTRTMRAEVELENPRGYLNPGMYGTASVLLEEREKVLVVPASALMRGEDGRLSVYHVVADEGDSSHGVLRVAEVEVGLDDGARVEVRRGLSGAERVVVRGSGAARPGDKVSMVSPGES
jgi:RND family efflux transporter MFP subunit